MRLPALIVLLVLAGCGGGSLPKSPAAPASFAVRRNAQAPRRAEFPVTHADVHLNLVFNYLVRNVRREIGLIDVVWGARSPYPRQVFNQFYTPFERDGPYGRGAHSLQWWKRYHPDWIEYRCNRTSVAWEFFDRFDVPLDIANPAVAAYQRSAAVAPALRAGYRSVDFDNLSLGNYAGRCGHYTTSGAWVAQYSGNFSDPAYARDVTAWAHGTYAYVHRFSAHATMAINYSYQSSSSFAQNYALMTQTDEVLDERGFTNWGGSRRNVTTPSEWRQIVRMIRKLQRNGTCYMENGEEPALSKDITQSERLWVVANYLLTRDDCTYVWMSGFSHGGAQQYGRILVYPEYGLKVGAPTGAATRVGRGWQRAYRNGLALVNPSGARTTFRFEGTYYDENGTPYPGSIALRPATGQILLRGR